MRTSRGMNLSLTHDRQQIFVLGAIRHYYFFNYISSKCRPEYGLISNFELVTSVLSPVYITDVILSSLAMAYRFYQYDSILS